MNTALRACAIVTGFVATACVAISLTWWFDPSFGYRAGSAVLFIAFMTGFLGFILMFGMLVERVQGRPRSHADLPALVSLIWRAVPRRLLVWLVVVLVTAIVSAAIAAGRAGQWGADGPYSWRNCHWPLSANHDTEHLCVSHARWLEVNLQTAHIFVGFGALFCTIACIAFITLLRTPRPMREQGERRLELGRY